MNVYYDAADYGYELVAEMDDETLSYEFHMLVVWRRISDGRLFWAEDSGCSCPSPFEDYTNPETGEWIRPIDQTRSEFQEAVSDFPVGPDKKQRMRVLASKPFGATVIVTSSGASLVM